MTERVKLLLDTLAREHTLSLEEYRELISGHTKEAQEYAASLAREIRERIYGKDVYIRGLIEISNICKNNCYYCGIRAANGSCDRYRLTKEQILECCQEGYVLGFRTFVMQGGEDGYFTDSVLTDLILEIKKRFPDCAVTLSLGERSYESYRALREAGADRYLLRHETASKEHYKMLHPEEMSFNGRMECLKNLRSLGYQVGCGFMVGSPYQSVDSLALDLKFCEEFSPDMCGIGPFIPSKDTPFSSFPAGDTELTLYLLSILRLIRPSLLLPATTALGTVSGDGRERGILAGANVVMPNLSPASVRKKYALYDNKVSDGAESAQSLDTLRSKIASVGYRVVIDRGDIKASL